jgi:hypothetical protein
MCGPPPSRRAPPAAPFDAGTIGRDRLSGPVVKVAQHLPGDRRYRSPANS